MERPVLYRESETTATLCSRTAAPTGSATTSPNGHPCGYPPWRRADRPPPEGTPPVGILTCSKRGSASVRTGCISTLRWPRIQSRRMPVVTGTRLSRRTAGSWRGRAANLRRPSARTLPCYALPCGSCASAARGGGVDAAGMRLAGGRGNCGEPSGRSCRCGGAIVAPSVTLRPGRALSRSRRARRPGRGWRQSWRAVPHRPRCPG